MYKKINVMAFRNRLVSSNLNSPNQIQKVFRTNTLKHFLKKIGGPNSSRYQLIIATRYKFRQLSETSWTFAGKSFYYLIWYMLTKFRTEIVVILLLKHCFFNSGKVNFRNDFWKKKYTGNINEIYMFAGCVMIWNETELVKPHRLTSIVEIKTQNNKLCCEWRAL